MDREIMVTKEMIRNSMEGQWRKRQIILVVIFDVICTIGVGEVFLSA